MSDSPKPWVETPLRKFFTKLVNGGTPSTAVAAYWGGTIPWVTGADFNSHGIGVIRRYVSELGIRSSSTSVVDPENLLVVTRTGVGKLAIAQEPIAISQDITGVYPDRDKADVNFLYFLLLLELENLKKLNQGTSINGIVRSDLERHMVYVPERLSEQRKIARILQTTDQAIEKTKALIEKYQQIKAGLMHDLFTRGIGPDGKLRPPREQAPDLYQETPIGWIPRDWSVVTVDAAQESLVDGPFGSNLKTEHYVADPGVRVVRLQNIQATTYNDADRAFVSESHAKQLFRNRVTRGDILIAGLGEERYPVGRACLYPADLADAINKADCFRLRCALDVTTNGFVMYFLNSAAARRQIRKFEQGVTRPRINLGNLKRVELPQASIEEQDAIVMRLDMVQHRIDSENAEKAKLLLRKSGLMRDLLTGKVEVNPDPPVAAHV